MYAAAGIKGHLPTESCVLFPPQATLFGGTDGPGHSLVYYFVLPEGFDCSKVDNQAAMRLFQRFVEGGTEADGTPSRDRLKMIARVVNKEEWAQKVRPCCDCVHSEQAGMWTICCLHHKLWQ